MENRYLKSVHFAAFRMMRLLTVLCVLGVTTAVQAQTAEKKISYKCKDTNLSEALKQVERKQDYYKIQFSYESVNTYKVSADIREKTVPEAVKQLVSGLGLNVHINGRSVLVSSDKSDTSRSKEPRWITGMVTDAQNEPLPGASVWIKESARGVATDINGKFTINVKPGDEISFSYIGMEQQTFIYNRGTHLDVQMREAEGMRLNEVVVTGYQTINRETLTGSVSTINSAKLGERYTPNVLDNLEGRIAGLSTYGGDLKIRGTSSLYAETSPLLVVDGLPIEGSINDLNPYNIESINVLKDAAATAIYGARASNGIIVITTKNARQKGKIDIDFQANLTISEKRNVDYNDNFYLNAAQQVAKEKDYFYYEFFDNNEGTDPIGSYESGLYGGTSDVSPLEYAYYQWAKGEKDEAYVNSLAERLSKNNFAKEFADAVYKQQVVQQYNLSLRSRSEMAQNSLTMNYKYDNVGIINNKFQQLNVSYKGIYDVAKWLTATVSIDGLYSNRREKGEDYTGDSYSGPFCVPAYMSLYNEDGTRRLFYPWYDGNEYSTVGDGFRNQGYDIVDEFYNNTLNTRRQRMRYHGELLFKPMKGLSLSGQVVYETDHTTASWLATEQSHVSATIRNAFTTRNPDGTVNYGTPETGGMLQTTDTNGDYWTGRFQANFDRTFGKHVVAAIAGLEFRETKYKGTKSLALGYDEQLQTSSTHTVNFATLALMRYNDDSGIVTDGYPTNQFVFNPYLKYGMGIVRETKHRYSSGYINGTYTYDSKYNAFFSFRKDWADVYGLNSKFRGKPLWSVGGGWNAHNETFVKDIKWIDFLKVRLTYGVTGNIYQGATSYMTAGVDGNNDYTGLPVASIISPANPNLRWEQNYITNLGVDYAVLDNRLRGSIDYYYKKGENLFSNKTLDPTTGFSSMFVNSANMVNKGIELQLSAEWMRSLHQKDFGWSTSFTFTYNKNEITGVENPASRAYEIAGYGSSSYVEGYPSSAIWTYRFAGYEDAESSHGSSPGETLWYTDDAKNPDGSCAHSASSKGVEILEYSGQRDPKYILGLDNRLTWNGFSLSCMLAYYGGHKMLALPKGDGFGASFNPIKIHYLHSWTPEETNPSGPGWGRYSASSSGSEPTYGNNAVHDAAFLKIRNIVFGYDFPHAMVQKWGIQHLGLRFQINNPGALWTANKVHVDPETLGIRTPGSFMFGLNVNI